MSDNLGVHIPYKLRTIQPMSSPFSTRMTAAEAARYIENLEARIEAMSDLLPVLIELSYVCCCDEETKEDEFREIMARADAAVIKAGGQPL